MLLFLLILAFIAQYIGTDISVPSFPSIANYFNVADGSVQLIMSYNFLGLCCGSLFFGPLSESYGRRKGIANSK